MPRHRHADGYVALVLEGGFEEAGESGRILSEPGHVVVHAPFAAHRDGFGPRGAAVLNLPATDLPEGVGCVGDPDAIVRLAERDMLAALEMLKANYRPLACAHQDWPDLLARSLRADPDLAISLWAELHELDPASVSRGFARVFGVSPKRYRLEVRTRRAVLEIHQWRGGLAEFAVHHGFADQAHMTRSIVALTGNSPARLRARLAAKSVQ